MPTWGGSSALDAQEPAELGRSGAGSLEGFLEAEASAAPGPAGMR